MKRGIALPAALAVALVALGLAGCASDALRSRQATGFNAYLDRIASACKPLIIGNREVGDALVRGGLYDADFNYFFDLTSRLYYGKTSIDAYRAGVTGFFGPGGDTTRALECVIAQLPADRPPMSGGPAVRLQ